MNTKNPPSCNIFVFLGPSLPLTKAQEILPEAFYLPPVKCGDILRVMRLKPEVILIIDGVFEKTAAVWHKEILYALEQGIKVFGASSMGALRAAELERYGMRGVGKVFYDYASGKLTDDDEVAILHGTEATGYQVITDPMVNIRATLESALAQSIVNQETVDTLIYLTKQTFYQRRTLKEICLSNIDKFKEEEIKRLITWLAQGGYIDQKALDAAELLELIRNSNTAVVPSQNKPHLERTIYFRTLQRSMQCQPFIVYKDWLPIQEKVALIARLFGKNYLLTQRLAYLLTITYNIAQRERNQSEGIFGLGDIVTQQSWQMENDCFDKDLKQFITRLNCLNYSDNEKSSMDYLVYLMQLSGYYSYYKKRIGLQYSPEKNKSVVCSAFKQSDIDKYNIMYTIATLFHRIDLKATQIGLIPDQIEVAHYANKFRFNHKLLSTQAMETWLQENDSSLEAFLALMDLAIRFDFLVVNNNADAIGAYPSSQDIWWFLDALRLTGLYQKAKRLYIEPKAMTLFLTEWSKLNINTHEYASYHGFEQGEAELNRFISMLSEQAENGALQPGK